MYAVLAQNVYSMNGSGIEPTPPSFVDLQLQHPSRYTALILSSGNNGIHPAMGYEPTVFRFRVPDVWGIRVNILKSILFLFSHSFCFPLRQSVSIGFGLNSCLRVFNEMKALNNEQFHKFSFYFLS